MNTNGRHSDIIMHHGVKGQRWGVRRYQNEDGSLTAAGKKHADSKDGNKTEKKQVDKKKIAKIIGISSGVAIGSAGLVAAAKVGQKFVGEYAAAWLLKAIFDPASGGSKTKLSLGEFNAMRKYL